MSIDIHEPGYLGQLAVLAEALSDLLGPVYGFVHQLTNTELWAARSAGRSDVSSEAMHGPPAIVAGYTKRLLYGLPTLYWVNHFGPAYIELFGRDALRSVPAFAVTSTRTGIVVRLTEHAPGESTIHEFEQTRQRAIDHLGRDAFEPDAVRVPPGFEDVEAQPWA